MLSPTTLALWIRAEYQCMPGLKLTSDQACRLWSVQRDTCDEALQALIDEGFLHRTGTGKFVCLPRPQRLDARPSGSGAPRAHVRCPHCLHLMTLSDEEAPHASWTSYRCEACRRVVTLSALSA